jgi:type IV fimbrial biogenesis protein FimT
MNHRFNASRNRGFTLVEGLATLTLGSLVLATGIPALSELMASNSIRSEVNSLVAHLQLTRSEAIKTGHRAVLCPSADGAHCLGSADWGKGYMVFVDEDADRTRDLSERVVRFRNITGDSLQIDAGSRRTVTYQATGWAPGSNLTIAVCDSADRAEPRAVVVSMTGRPRTADVDPSGMPLSCS